jgi:hypothetical protein
MKTALLLLNCLSPLLALAQQAPMLVEPLILPAELASPDNQFSGLYISQGKLFLLSESRLQEKAEGKIYALPLADIDAQLRDPAQGLSYQKYPLLGLAALRKRIDAAGPAYEGLEALVIDGSTCYFSVETHTEQASCYLLKGQLTPDAVQLDTTFLVTLPKPTQPDGSQVHNAGFEALARQGHCLLPLFEYNYFATGNQAPRLDERRLPSGKQPRLVQVQPLPFRITDITATHKRHFTALNYFFAGEDDKVYRTPDSDPASTGLIKSQGSYRSYSRLIDLKITGRRVKWKPLLEFPLEYRGYNWEGLAAYRQGYLVINDKYTPRKPFLSTLLYVHQK